MRYVGLSFLIIAFSFLSTAQHTHSSTGWSYNSSGMTQQCFYFFGPILINGIIPVAGINDGSPTGGCPSNNCDVIASFVKKNITSGPNINSDTIVCIGWEYYLDASTTGGMQDILASGSDMTNPYYANVGDSVFFKIYQASSGVIFDAISTVPIPTWTSLGTHLLDTLKTSSSITDINKESIHQQIIEIFPNPASKALFVNTNIKNVIIELFDIHGKKIDNLDNTFGKIFLENINLESGIYFMRLSNNEHSFTKRVVISNKY